MYVFESAHDFLYLSHVHKMLFDTRMLIGVSNRIKGQNFCMSLHQHPYFVYASREGSISNVISTNLCHIFISLGHNLFKLKYISLE